MSGDREFRVARLFDGVVVSPSAPIPLHPHFPPTAPEVIDAIRADLDVYMAERIRGQQAAPIRGLLSTFEDAKRARHRRLFGLPGARVFILGDRLVVVNPRPLDGGAA